MEYPSERSVKREPNWMFLVPLLFGVACLVLLFVPIMLTGLAGYDFLPSSEWRADSRGIAFGIGLIGAFGWMLLVLAVIDNSKPGRGLVKVLITFTSPLFGYFLGSTLVVATPPMILGFVAGKEVDLTYVVERSDGPGGNRCRGPVDIDDMPFGFDRICFVSAEFRATLAPGDRIVVRGRGTRYGVYVDSLRRDD